MTEQRKLWFKRKCFGWGWTPASIEGWIVTFAYCAALIFIFMRIDGTSHSASDTLYGVFLPFLALTVLLIIICYRTGESPRWQWGKRRDKESK